MFSLFLSFGSIVMHIVGAVRQATVNMDIEGQVRGLVNKVESLQFVSENLMLYQTIEDHMFEQGREYMNDEDIRTCVRIVYRYHMKFGTDGTIPIGLDYNRILAWIETESSFNPKAESVAGAIGLTQQMPFTAQEGLEKYLEIVVPVAEAMIIAEKPDVNLILGLERLIEYQRRFIGMGHASPTDWKLTFSLYNWSRKSVVALMSAKSKKTDKASLKYALDIERRMQAYKGGE
ncbi:hypothetical protein ES703_76008 [subsurface metagenome]